MKINSFSRLFAAVKFRDYVKSLPHLYEVALPIQQSIKMPTPPKLRSTSKIVEWWEKKRAKRRKNVLQCPMC